MKKLNTYIVIFIALVALLFGFTGCSNNSEPRLKLSFPKAVYEIEYGSTLEIMPNVENGSLDQLELNWVSYDENIVKYENGKLVAVNPGKTTVKVEVVDKPYVVAVTTIKVLYEDEMPTVTFGTVNSSMLLDDTQQITYSLSSSDVTIQAEYKSLNENVATVSDTGLITAVENGSAVITVKLIDVENPERYITQNFLITVTELIYNVNYVVYGGENNKANPKEYTDRLCPITLETPTRKGYTFKGWYLDNTYTQPITSIEKGTKENLTLFAKWEVDVYTISFDTNGGETLSNIDYTIETLGFYFPIPVKTGYTFVRWVDTTTNEERSFVKNGTLENIEVKAEWIPTVYTITYNFNNGVYTEDYVKEYTIEDETITLIVPTREHYIFDGWCADQLCETAIITEIPAGSYGNKVFYAKWTPVTYYISYEGLQFVGLQQGYNNSENPYQYNIESETILFKDPTRLGYNFKGWYLDSEHTTLITELPKGSYGDITLYADWEIIIYNIIYIGVDFTGMSASPIVNNPNESITTYTVEDEIILAEPTRPGYKFEGWTPTDKIEKGSTGDKTFEATWSIVTYNIEYTGMTFAGSASPTAVNTNVTTYTIEDEIILTEPTRTGYTFKGWTPTDKIEKGSTGDKTFEAQWELVEYSISYELNGGENAILNPSKYTIEDAVTLSNPTRNGYNFTGWVEGNSITAGSTGNKTFTASWSLIEYTINYELDGGTNPVSNPVSYTIESATFTLANPTKNGYTFKGWTPTDKIEKGSTGDKTFEAQWEVIKYTITYELNGGENPTVNPTLYTIESHTFTLTDPTRKGYNFTGWVEGNSITAGSTGNKTFTATWSLIEYTINYELDGGTNPVSNPASYTIESATFTLANPTKNGYEFKGWYTDSGLTVASDTTIEQGSIGELTFYASWEEKKLLEYSISGSSITITAINETDEENVVIPNEIDGIAVKEIAANVIANNKKVKTITIPASVTTINSYAFSGGLENDTAKNKVVPTDDDYTTNVEEFIVEEGNEKYFADESGVLCSRGSIGGESYTVIVSYPAALDYEVFTVAPDVKYINPGAFAGTKNLVTVLFTTDTKLEVISEAAFYGSNLTYIKIPKTVSGIRSSAFEECRKLGGSGSSFEFEEGNVNHNTGLGIGSYAFSNTGFSNFTVPKSCTSIYNKAFATDQTKYASSISKLYVYGDSLVAIQNGASSDTMRAEWNHRYVDTNTLITVSEL